MSMPPPIPHWTEKHAKGTARAGGRTAKRNGQTVEALAMAAAEVYAAQGLAVTRHVGPPVRQVGRPARNGTFSAIYEGEGPPDLLVTLPLHNRPARHGWIEVKGRSAASMALDAVEAHQIQYLQETARQGNPALILARLDHPTSGGWWLVPAVYWQSPNGKRKSLAPTHMSTFGCQCMDLNAPGRLARPNAVPDWLGALKALDSRGGCPWVQIWSHNTNTAA